jgi:hypothetical protein
MESGASANISITTDIITDTTINHCQHMCVEHPNKDPKQ